MYRQPLDVQMLSTTIGEHFALCLGSRSSCMSSQALEVVPAQQAPRISQHMQPVVIQDFTLYRCWLCTSSQAWRRWRHPCCTASLLPRPGCLRSTCLSRRMSEARSTCTLRCSVRSACCTHCAGNSCTTHTRGAQVLSTGAAYSRNAPGGLLATASSGTHHQECAWHAWHMTDTCRLLIAQLTQHSSGQSRCHSSLWGWQVGKGGRGALNWPHPPPTPMHHMHVPHLMQAAQRPCDAHQLPGRPCGPVSGHQLGSTPQPFGARPQT